MKNKTINESSTNTVQVLNIRRPVDLKDSQYIIHAFFQKGNGQ